MTNFFISYKIFYSRLFGNPLKFAQGKLENDVNIWRENESADRVVRWWQELFWVSVEFYFYFLVSILRYKERLLFNRYEFKEKNKLNEKSKKLTKKFNFATVITQFLFSRFETNLACKRGRIFSHSVYFRSREIQALICYTIAEFPQYKNTEITRTCAFACKTQQQQQIFYI